MGKRIVRVFCRRTSYTPDDDLAFVGPPPGLFVPEHDAIHISCVFTKAFERTWQRPAATVAHMREVDGC